MPSSRSHSERRAFAREESLYLLTVPLKLLSLSIHTMDVGAPSTHGWRRKGAYARAASTNVKSL